MHWATLSGRAIRTFIGQHGRRRHGACRQRDSETGIGPWALLGLPKLRSSRVPKSIWRKRWLASHPISRAALASVPELRQTGNRVIVLVAAEHVLLLLKMLVDWVVPTSPIVS